MTTAVVTPLSVLQAQLEVQRANLQRVRDAMASHAIDERLRDSVQVRFETRLNELALRLDGVEACARRPPIDACWSELTAIGRDAEVLLAECLAFLEGALVRSARIDRGVCAIADALLTKLAALCDDVKWSRLTILGEDDRVFSLADIIRLRFPEFTVWAVPLAAHELGHVVGRSHSGLSSKLASWKARDAGAEETFCDVFATYALGPAFACSALLLRFAPIERPSDGVHPQDAVRAAAVLDVLARLDALDGRRPYALPLARLREAWPEGALGEAAAERVAFLVDDIFTNLQLHVPMVRYRTWDDARRLSDELSAGADGADARDVLNAAWHARLRSWPRADVEAIEEAALELARQGVKP